LASGRPGPTSRGRAMLTHRYGSLSPIFSSCYLSAPPSRTNGRNIRSDRRKVILLGGEKQRSSTDAKNGRKFAGNSRQIKPFWKKFDQPTALLRQTVKFIEK
ncbi:hypothetical protein, partial [uncultured Rikenella sp.]|uniref:hypothetical protein n=1 Tax=uncultured Rikenella sp. TaxID=368003 RepID=UPI0026069A8D